MGKLKACVSLLHVGRVHNKPYRELKDSNDRPDEEVASAPESWPRFLGFPRFV